MPAVSKSAKIPSAWKLDELKAMLAAIDRNSPIGKRDYAMILLACVLGLRIGDIKICVSRTLAGKIKSCPSYSIKHINH